MQEGKMVSPKALNNMPLPIIENQNEEDQEHILEQN